MDNAWPANELEHLDRCPVCGAADATRVHSDLQDKLFHCAGDHWNVDACRTCGTHYLNPRPTPQTMGRAYAEYLTHEPPPTRCPKAPNASPAKRVRHLLRALANGYRNARWGTRLEPHLPAGRWLVPCFPPLRDALAMQMRNLPGRPPRPGARLLDVGCGNGAFLELAHSAGWSVQGTDFDAVAVAAARARGLPVQQGGMEILQAASSGSFDWICLSHVLEHVHDPVSWLRELCRVLRPGGTLWLQTPNIGSLGHERYGANWRGLEPPRHLTLFGLDTLCRALGQSGFASVLPLGTPVLTALDLYTISEALRRGLDHAAFMALPAGQRRHLRHLWPALQQHWSLHRAEFLTLVASR